MQKNKFDGNLKHYSPFLQSYKLFENVKTGNVISLILTIHMRMCYTYVCNVYAGNIHVCI